MGGWALRGGRSNGSLGLTGLRGEHTEQLGSSGPSVGPPLGQGGGRASTRPCGAPGAVADRRVAADTGTQCAPGLNCDPGTSPRVPLGAPGGPVPGFQGQSNTLTPDSQLLWGLLISFWCWSGGASYAPGRAHRARRPQALPAAAAAALSLQVILGPAWARGPAAGDPGLARLGVIISKEMKQGGAAGSEEGRAASCPCSQLAASPLPPSVDRGRPWPADVLASLCYRDLRPAPTPSATLRPAALLLSALPAGCHGNRGRGCSGTETDLSKRRPVPVPPPRGGRGEAPGREPHAGEPGPGWGPGHGFRQALPRPSAQGV